MIRRILGYLCVAAALGTLALVAYRNSAQNTETLAYSPVQMQTALWKLYQQTYLDPETLRTVDKQRSDVTTSEGQSYTLLRAAWMGDQPTFDTSWAWTQKNLAREGDNLFAWLWGLRPDGTYGILTDRNGQNSASDADANIALALLFAYSRWQDPAYLERARAIIADLWDVETLTIGGKTYVLANNVEKTASSPLALINPSYLSPALYRIFALVDREHPWSAAVSTSYEVLAASATLGGTDNARLPANWLYLNKETGALSEATAPGTDSNYGYDALRVPWNLALDWTWFRDERARETARTFSRLGDQWRRNGKLFAGYARTGDPIPQYAYETPAMYGGSIGYFMLADPSAAADIYQHKLAYLFMPDWNGWRQPLSYYDDNWAWFGIGLYNGLLPNLMAGAQSSSLAQQ